MLATSESYAKAWERLIGDLYQGRGLAAILERIETAERSQAVESPASVIRTTLGRWGYSVQLRWESSRRIAD